MTALPLSAGLLRPLRVAGVLAASVVLIGCTGDDQAEVSPTTSPVPGASRSVDVPLERGSTFCEAMTDLIDRIESDPPDDVRAAIVETYVSIADQVPEVIAADFAAVLDDLRRGVLATTAPPTTGAISNTTTPFAEEGYAPEDTPALRVNAYVEEACTGSRNNPGPPDTEPGQDVTTDS